MRERNPSDSLKNRVGNFFRRTAEGLKKLGATGLALVTFAGGLAGCSAHNVEATPEVSTSSTTATPKATGESSSTDTPSNTPSTEQATSNAPDTPTPSVEKSSATPSVESTQTGGEILSDDYRYNHPNTIEARSLIDDSLAPLKDSSYTDVYLRNVPRNEIFDNATDFRVALYVDSAINYEDVAGMSFQITESGSRNNAYHSAYDILKIKEEDGGVEGVQLLAEGSLASPIAYALAQKEGSTSVVEADADTAPLDVKRANDIYALAFGHMLGSLGEQAQERVGLDINETKKLLDVLYAPLQGVDTVKVLTRDDLQITDVKQVSEPYTIITGNNLDRDDDKERTVVDIEMTINGVRFCVVYQLNQPTRPIGTTQESPNRDTWEGRKGEAWEHTLQAQDGTMLSTKTGEPLFVALPIGAKPINSNAG